MPKKSQKKIKRAAGANPVSPSKKKKSSKSKKTKPVEKRVIARDHLIDVDLIMRLDRIEAALDKLVAAPMDNSRPASRPVSRPTPSAPNTQAAVLRVSPAGFDTAEFLSRTPLFAKLSPPECAKLAQHCQLKEIASGAMLFAEGDFGDSLYVVKEGALEIFKKDVLGDLPIAVIRPGGMVGEMALIEGKPRSANVRAVEDGKLLFLSKAAYERLKREHPEVATKFQDELLLLFSNRLRQTTEKLVDNGGNIDPRPAKGI